MTTAKRVFLYVVSLVALCLLAVGIARLFGQLLALPVAKPVVIIVGDGLDTRQFSLSLAMILIGGGVWWGFWRSIRKSLEASPEETGAAFRKLYLNFIQAVSAVIGIIAATDSLAWIFGGSKRADYQPMQLAAFVVAAGVWYFHWRISEKEGHPSSAAVTLRRWYIYILSGWGLTLLGLNLVYFVNNTGAFFPFWDPLIVGGNYWGTVSQNLACILAGGVTWWFFWFKMARADSGSSLRQVYYYLFTITGSAVAGLTAVTNLLYWLAGYFIGLPSQTGSYFRFLCWTLPAALVAAGVWFYHQRMAQEEADATAEKHFSARRVYLYLMSFISLGTLVAGLVVLIGILLQWIISAVNPGVIVSSSGWWQGQLSASVALLVVGVPIWVYFWGNVLKMVASAGAGERRTRSRRIFLYAVLGAAILATVAGLVNLVYLLLNAALQGGEADLLRNIRWSLQSLAVSVPVLLYFWGVIRSDQKLGAEAAAWRKEITLLIPGSEVASARKIEDALGYRVRILRSLREDVQAETSDEDIKGLAGRIQSEPGGRMLLVKGKAGWLIFPYEEK